MSKDVNIKFRIDNLKKSKWKMVCRERHISMTDLIIDSVENRIFDNERKDVLAFMEKQDNIFIKIQTNINQVARMMGRSHKKISDLVAAGVLKATADNRIFESSIKEYNNK